MDVSPAHYRPSRVRTAADVYALVGGDVPPADGAELRTVHLDGAGRVLGISASSIRQGLREAMTLGSTAIIVVRLSTGDATVSTTERAACAELIESAQSLGIKLLDYLLFAPESFSSFRALGLL